MHRNIIGQFKKLQENYRITRNYRKMKNRIINYITKLVSLSLLAGFTIWAAWYSYRIYRFEETNNAQVEEYISPISSRVIGYVSDVYCQENQHVCLGDTILVIESDEYDLEYRKNEALLHKAEAEYKMTQKNIDVKEMMTRQMSSQLEISKYRFINSEIEFKRIKNLLEKESITQQQYDKKEMEYKLAKEEVSIAKYKYEQSILERDDAVNESLVALSKVETNKALLDKSKLDLQYTVVKAPYCGMIGKIDIQKGQLLQSGEVITFITNEAAGKWIVANVKETQLESYKVGKEVEVSIDAFPNMNLKGVVESISPATGTRFSLMPPNNATGNFVKITQRVPVRIKLTHTEKIYDELRGGMNAYVSSKK